MLELCTQTTNDTVLAMLRIFRNPFVHRVLTVELTKRQVVRSHAAKNTSEAGEVSAAKPAQADEAEGNVDKPAEEATEGEMEGDIQAEADEKEMETEEIEAKEEEAKPKEGEQTASPAKASASGSSLRQPIWNEIKETG